MFKHLVEAIGLTNEQIVQRFGISRMTLYNYTKGKSIPSDKIVQKFVKYNQELNEIAASYINKEDGTVNYPHGAEDHIVARAMIMSGIWKAVPSTASQINQERRRYYMTDDEYSFVTANCDNDDERLAAVEQFNQMLETEENRAVALTKFI